MPVSVGEVAAAARGRPPGGSVIAPPLMHASGTWLVLFALLNGSRAILSPTFDPAQVLRLVSAEKATVLGVIGDAMARPIADELAARPDRYDLSSLVVLSSGGAVLSRSVHEQIQAAGADALREHCRMTLAGYKVPARIEVVTQAMRSPVGKADYRWARAVLAGQEPAPPRPS